MSDYRRVYVPGGTYFFTVVTYGRRPFLTEERARACLRHAWRQAQERQPFTTEAVCLLPDHLHCVWTLPEDDADFSARWNRIKGLFTKTYRAGDPTIPRGGASRRRKGEAAIWQRRFWEHRIRDEEDFRRHVDYVHHNPVKHGLVCDVRDWPWSSFHRCRTAT